MQLKHLILGLLALLMASLSFAQSFTYQGYLREGGLPANGNYQMTFRLFSVASGGTALASIGPVSVTVSNGLFTQELNFGNVWTGADRWLEIQVGSTALTPRVKINRTPYAIRANTAGAANPIGSAGGDLSGTYPNPTVAKLQGRAVSATAPTSGQVLKWDGSAWSPETDLSDTLWQLSGNDISNTNSGNVGIGVSDPLYRLHVETASGGRAIFGSHTAAVGGNVGVFGETYSPSGRGVYGYVVSATGENSGVEGVSASVSGKGVFGWTYAISGINYGVYGSSISTEGRGVYGLASATSGVNYGGRFESASTSGMGVYGLATAASGITYGGRFDSASTEGKGVYGWATANSGSASGVVGQTNSSASNAYGVHGIEPSGGAGHAVYAFGTFAASGTKSFQIDHPLRPETHYLNHFCTEAPEPLNTYSGNVVTDAQGYATVRLPDYFEAINRDFRYQLTVIDGAGEEFVQARVARKIQNNQFVIRTSKPFVEVSWEVKAVRNDRWVQQYGYQTEQEKEDEIKGKYLYPELYGQPKERGIHYHPEPARPEAEPARPNEK